MNWYIKSHSLGYFVGAFLGLGFFETHVKDGSLSLEERPLEFETQEEAQGCLDSWIDASDCYITDVPPG